METDVENWYNKRAEQLVGLFVYLASFCTLCTAKSTQTKPNKGKAKGNGELCTKANRWPVLSVEEGRANKKSNGPLRLTTAESDMFFLKSTVENACVSPRVVNEK